MTSSLPLSDTTRVEAAEGETAPTEVATRRLDDSRIEPQGAAVGRRTSGTRPAVAAFTDDPLLTVIEIDVPATDKSQW